MSFAKTIAVEQAPTKTFRDNKENYKWWYKAPSAVGYTQESTEDGLMVKRFYKSDLHIEENQLLTPSNRCKGFFVFVEGDLIVDGAISMSARGCIAAGDNISIDYINKDIKLNDDNFGDGTYDYEISATGGSGASYRNYYNGANSILYANGYVGSASGTTFACGGGGSGGACSKYGRSISGNGSTGTSYSGGAGGGGATVCGGTADARSYSGNGTSNGGRGGYGYYVTGSKCSYAARAASGGAGNPGGAYRRKSGFPNTYEYGDTGTGGLLIIIVKGNIIINETGLIKSNGANGGNGAWAQSGGGSSGGGSINILHGGTLTNNGTIQANGGVSSGSGRGGNGGAGTVRVEQVIF